MAKVQQKPENHRFWWNIFRFVKQYLSPVSFFAFLKIEKVRKYESTNRKRDLYLNINETRKAVNGLSTTVNLFRKRLQNGHMDEWTNGRFDVFYMITE